MRVQEIWLGVGLILWACLLLGMPRADLAWPALANLLAIMPRADNPVLFYALVAFMVGGMQILGAIRDRPFTRRAAAIAAFTVWAFIAGGEIGHRPFVPCVAAYGTLALMTIRPALGRG